MKISDFCKLCQENNKTTEQLSLANHLLSDAHFQAIINALSVNTTLRELNLSCTKLDALRLNYLVLALTKHPQLEILNLSINSIANSGLKMVARLCQQNTAIHTVIMGHNDIGDLGVKWFSETLRGNKTLREIDFGHCPEVTPKGVAYLVDFLRKNPRLMIREKNDFKQNPALKKLNDRNVCYNDIVNKCHLIQAQIGQASADDIFPAFNVILQLIETYQQEGGFFDEKEYVIKHKFTSALMDLLNLTLGKFYLSTIPADLKNNTDVWQGNFQLTESALQSIKKGSAYFHEAQYFLGKLYYHNAVHFKEHASDKYIMAKAQRCFIRAGTFKGEDWTAKQMAIFAFAYRFDNDKIDIILDPQKRQAFLFERYHDFARTTLAAQHEETPTNIHFFTTTAPNPSLPQHSY